MKALKYTVAIAALMTAPAFAGSPIVNPPVHPVAFGSQPASGPLYFGPGTVAKVNGKFFNATSAVGGAVIYCHGCAGVDIENNDFDVPILKSVFIENAGTPANPIPIVIVHNRCKNPADCIIVSNSTAAPSSTITHNQQSGITSKFHRFIEVGNNSGGLPSTYCTSRGLPAAACVLKLWYDHIDGKNPDTGADPVYPAGSVGMMIGNGATLASTGYITTIYDDFLYPGAVGEQVAGGTNVVVYYNSFYSTPDVSGSVAALKVSKDPASILPAVPPSIDVSYFIRCDSTGCLPGIKDDGSMGNTTYLSNVGEDVDLKNNDLNDFIGPE